MNNIVGQTGLSNLGIVTDLGEGKTSCRHGEGWALPGLFLPKTSYMSSTLMTKTSLKYISMSCNRYYDCSISS